VKNYAISAGAAFLASLLVTVVVRSLARRLGLVAKPRADRWHRRPTALFGGVGIYIGFVAGFLAHRPADAVGDWLLIVCSSAMFVLGLIDDLVQLKPYAKLIGQIAVSSLFTMYGLRLHWLPSPPLDQALTIFWLVGITNAVNLLDNLDGLAGGVAAIAASYLVYFCHSTGQPAAATLAAAFCGALVGFLVFNFNPASVFMGDCGSLFIGFFLAGLTMVNNQGGLRRNIVAVLAIPVLLLLIPIVDTTLVTVNRKLHGRPVSQGGRDHTSHRLVALGLSERTAALTLWTLAAASGAIAVVVQNLTSPTGMLVIALFGLGLLFFAVFVGRVKIYEAATSETSGRALLPTLADFSYKRRIFEVLNDLVLIVICWHTAFLLRFDGQLASEYYRQVIAALPLVITVQLGAMLALGLYQGLWRYTSMSDLSTLIKAVTGAWVASMLTIVFVFRLQSFSRGMLVMDGILLLFGVAGTRVSFRLIRIWLLRLQPRTREGRRILIYGAGDGGELLVRELQNNHELGLHPVGFIDDDPQKEGRMIHGVRVLGPLERMRELASSERIDELVISTTRIQPQRTQMAADLCQDAGVACRRMRIALE
jgi:UDP-GlcNAc:undecaprenyl-phosphate GlcNAc-1-phosphate transferase